jgi:hypothetical protein
MELTVQEQTHSTGAAESPPDITKRLRAIRAGLPGQMLKERLQTARICYGMLYTEAEIRKKVADTLPPRVGLVRGAVLEPIENYSPPFLTAPSSSMTMPSRPGCSRSFSSRRHATMANGRWTRGSSGKLSALSSGL